MVTDARVLVLGRGGWLGSPLWELLGARRAVAHGPRSAELDIRDAARVQEAIDAFEPTAVLNLAAARPSAGEDELQGVNVDGARIVAEACARSGTRLVHVSTDALLDGHNPPYADDAPASPLTPYGRSKAAGEAAVLGAHPRALCVRTSLIWDPEALDRGTKAFAMRLQAGGPCLLFTDEIRCPLPRAVLGGALMDLVDLQVSGTLNVAGREAMSRHDFGLALLKHFEVPRLDRIQRIRAEDLERKGGAPRPRDLRLLVDRAEELLGYGLPGVTELLRS